MTSLADFLLARIAEDAEIARDILAWPKSVGILPGLHERKLVECEAHRRIVELHRPLQWIGRGCRECHSAGEHGCPTLRLLALPYADHPDYSREWKP